jgi:cyanophycinase
MFRTEPRQAPSSFAAASIRMNKPAHTLVPALLALLLVSCAPFPAQTLSPGSHFFGPAQGSLVIAGGGDLYDTGIVDRFLELAGGPDALIVVIPTADGNSEYTEEWPGLEVLRAAGATNIRVLHTYDRATADSPRFVQPIREAAGIWFPGGRQHRLADAYLDTRTQSEILALLGRGGVVGGSSAGASIQASYLVRGAPEGNHILMSPGNDRGFGLIRNTAIDQHLLVRNRQKDLLQLLEAQPGLLGIGIDEGTAIVVQRDTFEVIGRSRVAVYDRSERASEEGFYLLSPGERYDIRSRSGLGDMRPRALEPDRTPQALP